MYISKVIDMKLFEDESDWAWKIHPMWNLSGAVMCNANIIHMMFIDGYLEMSTVLHVLGWDVILYLWKMFQVKI